LTQNSMLNHKPTTSENSTIKHVPQRIPNLTQGAHFRNR
jgi:hypothetical protein